METVTSAVGLASRTTVNVEVEPASVVRRLPEPSVVPVWAMEMPAVSLSVFFRVVETAFDPETASVGSGGGECCCDVAIVDAVVDACDGDGLSGIPVAGCECQR